MTFASLFAHGYNIHSGVTEKQGIFSCHRKNFFVQPIKNRRCADMDFLASRGISYYARFAIGVMARTAKRPIGAICVEV